MDEKLILRLIDIVETASEKLWGIAYRQVYVDIVHDFLWFVSFAVLAFVLYKTFKRYWKEAHKEKESRWDDKTGSEIAFVLSGLGIAFCFMVLFISVGEIIGKLINPEYYAIKVLLDLVR